jgi:hypothetical protein
VAATIEKPESGECSDYYLGYVNRVPEGDVLDTLAGQTAVLEGMLGDLSEEQASFSFAPGEWSIKEVVGHLVDAERTFSYRAFAISRDQSVNLPGMDPDDYAREGRFGEWSLDELLEELAALRRANVIAFRHLSPEASRRRGVASGSPVSVRALIYILAGHVNYHFEDLEQKYLPGLGR